MLQAVNLSIRERKKCKRYFMMALKGFVARYLTRNNKSIKDLSEDSLLWLSGDQALFKHHPLCLQETNPLVCTRQRYTLPRLTHAGKYTIKERTDRVNESHRRNKNRYVHYPLYYLLNPRPMAIKHKPKESARERRISSPTVATRGPSWRNCEQSFWGGFFFLPL